MKKIIVFFILVFTTISLNAQTYRVYKMEEYIKRGDYGYLQIIKELEFNGNENTISMEEDGFRATGSIFKKNKYIANDCKVLDDKSDIWSMTFKYEDNGTVRIGDWVTFYALDYYEILSLYGEISLYGQTVEAVTRYYLKEIK